MKSRTKRQSGVVLIAVVWGVMVLTAMALGLATLVRSGTEELRARKEHLQGFYVARGALYRAAFVITAAGENFRPGQRSIAWREEDGTEVAVEVNDESGKLDLNQASPELLRRLLLQMGMRQMDADALVASIQDWRDPDTETRLGGAEELYYLAQPQPYRPANANFRSVEELLLVKGVNPQLFWGGWSVDSDGGVQRRAGLRDLLTANGRGAAVNINYAPRQVLLAVPGVDERMVGYILEGRERKPFASVSDLSRDFPVMLGGETLNYLTTGMTGRFSLVASATLPGGVTARIRALMQVNAPAPRRQAPATPFSILEMDELYAR